MLIEWINSRENTIEYSIIFYGGVERGRLGEEGLAPSFHNKIDFYVNNK
jgi:hypothetical protein